MRKHGMRKTTQYFAESIRVLCGKYSSTLRRVLHGTAEVSFPPAGRFFFIWLKFVYACFLELPPECAYFAAIERPSHPHVAEKNTRMKELVKRLRAVLATACLLGLSPSCTTPPQVVVEGMDFAALTEMARADGQSFCIALVDTTDITSQIYLRRLKETATPGRFNLVYKNFTKSNAYEQWLFSNAAPVTCVFSPDDRLIDIIPGASRKCFSCIGQVVRTGKMTQELAYYNNFGAEKQELIPLLDEVMQARLRLDRGEDATEELRKAKRQMDYPYLAYLDMQNALRNGCQARADSLAGRLLACEGDLELELYPELLIAALRTLHPERDIAREARLEAPSVVRLGDCVQGVPRPFRLPLTNAGQQSLSVEGIEMSCSCLELFDDMDFTLAPGETKELEMEFTADQEKRIEREIIVRNSGLFPVRRIRIIANGRPPAKPERHKREPAAKHHNPFIHLKPQQQ